MFKRPRRRHGRHAARQDPTRLDICTRCDADYVHPVEWHESDDEHWWMLLRCGECWAEREVTVGDSIAKRFDVNLHAAEQEIRRAVARLDAERMATEIEVFTAALERDLIDPVDFR